MDEKKIEKARQLLNILEMRNSKTKVETLIKLLCIEELSKTRKRMNTGN